MEQELPEAFLLANTLVVSKTVIKNKCKEDTGQQGKPHNSQLDCPPKWFLPAVVHRPHCVADHGVAEEYNPDRDKSIENEEKVAQERSEGAEDSSNPVSAKN